MSWACGLPQSHLCTSWKQNDSWHLGRIWAGRWNLPAGTPCLLEPFQTSQSLWSPGTQKDLPNQQKKTTRGLKKKETRHKKLVFHSYSAVLLQLAAVVRNAVEKTLVDDALWDFFPNQFSQDRGELPLPDRHVWGTKKNPRMLLSDLHLEPQRWEAWNDVRHPDCVTLYLADVHAASWAPGVVSCRPAMAWTFPRCSSPNTARPAPLLHPAAPSRSQTAKGGSPVVSAWTSAALDLEHAETIPIKKIFYRDGLMHMTKWEKMIRLQPCWTQSWFWLLLKRMILCWRSPWIAKACKTLHSRGQGFGSSFLMHARFSFSSTLRKDCRPAGSEIQTGCSHKTAATTNKTIYKKKETVLSKQYNWTLVRLLNTPSQKMTIFKRRCFMKTFYL